VSRAEDSDSPSNRPLGPRKAAALWTLHHKKGMTIMDLCAEFRVSPGFVKWKVRSDNGGNTSEKDIQQLPYHQGSAESKRANNASLYRAPHEHVGYREGARPSYRGRHENYTSREGQR